MKRINLFISGLSLFFIVSLFACSGNKTVKKAESPRVQTEIPTNTQEVKNPVTVGTETSLLLK
jgi:hypothetical protein